MKSAIYIEDGTIQLVITPETKFEKDTLKTFEDKKTEAQIFIGAFYDCRGGWVRQAEYYPQSANRGWGDTQERSLILRVKTEKE